MTRSLRQISTKCAQCGVVYDEHNPKQVKRALCVPCYRIEMEERNQKLIAERKEAGAFANRILLYKNYKVQNREPFWNAINKELKPLNDRTEIKAFISKQMDRILEDKDLMHYINYISVAEQRKTKR